MLASNGILFVFLQSYNVCITTAYFKSKERSQVIRREYVITRTHILMLVAHLHLYIVVHTHKKAHKTSCDNLFKLITSSYGWQNFTGISKGSLLTFYHVNVSLKCLYLIKLGTLFLIRVRVMYQCSMKILMFNLKRNVGCNYGKLSSLSI